jgi:hypothetical protein
MYIALFGSCDAAENPAKANQRTVVILFCLANRSGRQFSLSFKGVMSEGLGVVFRIDCCFIGRL